MIKKLNFIGSLIVFLFSLAACSTSSKDTFSITHASVISPSIPAETSIPETTSVPEVTPVNVTTPVPDVTSVPEVTSIPELPSVFKEIPVSDEAPASEADSAPDTAQTGITEDLTSQTHKVISNNGKLTATAYTTAEFSDFNEVIDRIIIQTEVNSYEISDIIGYYDNMQWSYDDTKLVISYYGRQWGNFIIIDIANKRTIYPETYYEDIRKHFEDLGYSFDYEPNASRPDPYIYFDGWSEDSQSFKITYTVKDTDWQTQSGSFRYDLTTGEMKDFEQYPPYQQG